jgi:flagellar motor switch protein FliN/FliY
MTLQAPPVDLDAVLAAARAVVPHLGVPGELDVRALGPDERAGHDVFGGITLSVHTAGANPGEVGLVAGAEVAEVTGDGDALERWEPVMAAIVVAMTDRVGDLEPKNVQVLAPESGNGPALEQRAISVGLFRGDEMMAAVGFVAEQVSEAGPAQPVVAAAPAVPDLAVAPTPPTAPVGPPAQIFQTLVGGDTATVEARRMHLLRDVEMGVSVELGRTRMTVRDLLALAPGIIVELDKAAGAPVDLLVNGILMARGEVVVIDEEFAVRISEIVTPEQDTRLGA